MSVRSLQWALAAVFFLLGGWCVVAPANVMDLAFRPGFRSDAPIATFAIAGFGSQALISGLFAATARFTRTTFAAYAAALIPFFVFDAWFYWARPVLSEIGLADLAGNLVMLGVCALGWRTAGREARAGAGA
jgi:hypothetical protein